LGFGGRGRFTKSRGEGTERPMRDKTETAETLIGFVLYSGKPNSRGNGPEETSVEGVKRGGFTSSSRGSSSGGSVIHLPVYGGDGEGGGGSRKSNTILVRKGPREVIKHDDGGR